MTPPRFHCPASLAPGAELTLPPEVAHHAVRVLRLGVGDVLLLFDGRGAEFRARITRIERDAVRVAVGAPVPENREACLRIVLAQGVSSGDRMDYTLQKAVELGVEAVYPLETERSTVRLRGERAEKRVAHWQRVAVAACEQCGRSRVPPVHPVTGLAPWLADLAPGGCRLLLSPEGTHRLSGLPGPAQPVILLAGPEGGFSPAEVTLALDHGFIPLRLGPRILRTETAALAAMSALHALWGDFR